MLNHQPGSATDRAYAPPAVICQQRVPIPPPIVAEMPTHAERELWTEEELGVRAQLIGLVHRPDRASYTWRTPRRRWFRLLRLTIVPVRQEQRCTAPGCGRIYPCDAAQWAARAFGLDTARM